MNLPPPPRPTVRLVWRSRAAPRLVGGLLVALALAAVPFAGGLGEAAAEASRGARLGAASTATPFTVGAAPGEKEWLVVDERGTAHIVWEEPRAGRADAVHYCQIPRGSKACTHAQTLVPDVDGERFDFAGPKVVLVGSGEVLVVTNRCCASDPKLDGNYAYLSSDGGASFGQPYFIGTNPPSGDAEFGPGSYSISTVTATATEGAQFQAEPFTLGAAPRERARLDAEVPVQPGRPKGVYDGSVALVDPTTPIVAFDDLRTIYYRRWSGAGDLDSTASWLPLQTLGAGSEAQLTGGPRGVFLIYRTGSPDAYSYVASRYDGNAFASSEPISPSGTVKFRDISEDGSGNLHALWVHTGSRDELEYAVSTDGSSWSKPVTLASSTVGTIFDPHVRAALDGGGFATWDTTSGAGTIRAVALPPLSAVAKPPNASCPSKLRFGVVRAIARQGCFAKHGASYTITGPIRVNGLDIDAAGSGIRALAVRGQADAPLITIDPGAGTLRTAAAVLVSAGAVKLDQSPLDWHIPLKGGPLQDSAGNPAALDAGKLGTKLLGLQVSGYVTPTFLSGAADLPINLELPLPVSGAVAGPLSSNIHLRTDIADVGGLEIEKGHVHIHVDDAFFGIAELQPLDLDYTADPAILKGQVGLLLPVIGSRIDSTFEFENGDFVDATASFTPRRRPDPRRRPPHRQRPRPRRPGFLQRAPEAHAANALPPQT